MFELNQKEYLGARNLLSKNADGINVVEVEYREKVFEGWHSHKNAHVTLFLRGGTVEKRRESAHAFGFGDLAFYRGGEPHLNYQTRFPSKNINIEIEASLLKKLEITETMIEKSIADKVASKLLILKIYRECLIDDDFSGDTKLMLIAQYAAHPHYFEGFTNCPAWVGKLYEILNDCWNETPTLSELGKCLNLNPITISKYFPRFFGCSFGEYMRKIKVERALAMIRQGKISQTEIAYECGFADQSHFIRTFKRQTGFRPKQFQRI